MTHVGTPALPPPDQPFAGVIAEKLDDAKAAPTPRLTAPDGAPNIFVFMSDDVGFAMTSAFGGPVPTPNYERLASRGQRYNRFHTTGICSPSYRAHYEGTAKRIAARLDESMAAGLVTPGDNEVRAWALMGMNVFLGLRFGVWSEDRSVEEIGG